MPAYVFFFSAAGVGAAVTKGSNRTALNGTARRYC